MKFSYGKLFIAGLICAGVCLAVTGVRAEEPKAAAMKKEVTTVTGTAKAVANKTDATKKHLELTDKAGAMYLLLSKTITAEEVAKFDGKTITAKGTVKEKDGKKTLYVSGAIEEAK